MRPRTGSGGAAVLLAALFPLGCLQTVVLPPLGVEAAGGSSGLDAGPLVDGGGGTGDRDGATDRNTTCTGTDTNLSIRRPWPSIVVAVDHTNTMGNHFGNGTRLEEVSSALTSRLNKYGQVVRFGYVEFPGMSRSCSNTPNGCCVGPVTQPAPNTENGILSALGQCFSGSGCVGGDGAPTAQMLAQVNNAYADLLTSGRGNSTPAELELRFVLLITDGEPFCATGVQGDPCVQAANEVAGLSIQGIKTFVVVVGDVPNDDTRGGNACLNSLANVSGIVRSAVGPFYYPATSDNALGTHLTSIITQTVCHLELLDEPADPDRTEIQFSMQVNAGSSNFMNVPVPRDTTHINGWDYERTADTKVTFYGAACGNFIDTVLNGGMGRVHVQGCPIAAPGH
jgi:hypothetical protein